MVMLPRVLIAFLLALPAIAAEVPLPELRIEPVDGGSIVYVKNVSAQPLTAFLIELVDYPGSSYSLWQEEVDEPIPPGVEKRIPVTNMTVGAVPDYVRMQAAIYADGTSSGVPPKVAQCIARRRFVFQMTRELIHRIESGQAASLREWADSLRPQGRLERNSQSSDNVTARSLIANTIKRIENHSIDDALTTLRAYERAFAASKPAL